MMSLRRVVYSITASLKTQYGLRSCHLDGRWARVGAGAAHRAAAARTGARGVQPRALAPPAAASRAAAATSHTSRPGIASRPQTAPCAWI